MLVFLLTAALTNCHTGPAQLPTSVSLDEVAVYNDWLKQYAARHPEQTLRASALTVAFPDISSAKEFAEAPPDLITKARSYGDALYYIAPPLLYKAVPEIDPFPNPKGNNTFALFSRVAITADGTNGLVYIHYGTCNLGSCGGGQGRVFSIERIKDIWTFKGIGPAWIS